MCVRTALTNSLPQGRLRIRLVQTSFFDRPIWTAFAENKNSPHGTWGTSPEGTAESSPARSAGCRFPARPVPKTAENYPGRQSWVPYSLPKSPATRMQQTQDSRPGPHSAVPAGRHGSTLRHPGLTSWAILRCPCGTELVSVVLTQAPQAMTTPVRDDKGSEGCGFFFPPHSSRRFQPYFSFA
jgi:hypothetical protein